MYKESAGSLFDVSSWKIAIAINTVIPRLILSPDSGGKIKESSTIMAMRVQGTTKLIM